MIITGKEKPSEILVGLVNRFVFNDQTMEDSLSGHPKQGRVYRILKDSIPNSEDFLYRLHIGNTENKSKLDGILLGNSLNGDHFGKWEYEIVELTPENYFQYKIQEEDLKKITTWFDTKNEDLKELLAADITLTDDQNLSDFETIDLNEESELKEAAPMDQELRDIFKGLSKQITKEAEYDEALQELMRHLDVIVNSSKGKTLALLELVRSLSDRTSMFYETFIKNSDTDESFISGVLTLLTTHENKDKRVVIEIMRCCLAELQRLNKDE